MEAHDVIVRPIINEKTMLGMPQKMYTFEVAANSNKIEIRKAVEKIFKVKVSKINVTKVRGHLRRKGRTSGYTPSWKKAMVTLNPESKGIEFFENLV